MIRNNLTNVQVDKLIAQYGMNVDVLLDTVTISIDSLRSIINAGYKLGYSRDIMHVNFKTVVPRTDEN